MTPNNTNTNTETPDKDATTDQTTPTCDRRTFAKFLSGAATVVGSSSGLITMTAQPASAQDAWDDEFLVETTNRLPANTLEHVKFDGDTKFEIGWEGMNRGEIIDLYMNVKLVDVLDGNGNHVYSDSNRNPVKDWASTPIGQVGVRVDESKQTKQVKGKEFFEKRDYIALTERSRIEPDDVDVLPEETGDLTRESIFHIRVKTDPPGLASPDTFIWKMKLIIKGEVGFGFYFGPIFDEYKPA